MSSLLLAGLLAVILKGVFRLPPEKINVHFYEENRATIEESVWRVSSFTNFNYVTVNCE